MIRRAVAAIAMLGAGMAATAAERQDPVARELAGRVPGPPVDCVDQSRLRTSFIVDERTIVYRDGGRLWRNDLPDQCRGLRPLSTLVVDVYNGRLCRDDHFRALESGSAIPTAYCRLGRFTPYDKPR